MAIQKRVKLDSSNNDDNNINRCM